jgi:hypothetical protein
MSADFSTLTRSRSWANAFSLVSSAALFLIGASALTSIFVLRLDIPMVGTIALSILTFVGVLFFAKEVRQINSNKEREFRVDATALRWFERDDHHEHVEGEIPLSDIQALICRNADGEPPAFFEIEFCDSTVGRIPSFYLDTRPRINAFVEYWKHAHPDIPIRDPDRCLPTGR